MIKKLSLYMGEYRKYIFIVPIFVMFDVLCELSMPLLMSKIIDDGIAGADVQYIVKIGLLMMLLALSAMVFGVFTMKFTAIGSQGFGANLRDALFNKVQQFSFNNIDRFNTASLVTRLTNDVNNLQMTLLMVLRILLRAPMMLVVAFIMAININGQLSLVLAVAIPVLAISVWFIISRAVKLFAIVQEKLDVLNRTIQENLIGIRVVKSFVRTDFEKEKFKSANDGYTQSAIDAANIAILNMPVMMFVLNGATLAIIWMGGKMVYVGSMGTGELISFLSYVMQILISVMMISMIILMGARAQASGNRVIEVLDTEIDIRDEESRIEKTATESIESDDEQELYIKHGKVEFRDVSFKYNVSGSGENVLSNMSFKVDAGSVVAIVGGTGTGKTTMVNLIPRLYDVTDGEVLIDDVDVRHYRLENLRDGIGVVLQKNVLFSGTILDNLKWGNENATQEEIESVCKDAQAHDFIMSFSNGYATMMGQGGVNVSGGQKQRLCIARAMLKKPKILILDDSTSAVDSSTEAKIRESFYHNFQDTTVFIIAQRISSVKDADMIIVVDDGKIVGMGTHQELLAGNKVYQEINSSQQEGVFTND